MPYSKTSELPDAVRKLPAHAQDIYLAAFNGAFKQYKGDEGKSHATAWTAVETKYKKNKDGTWVLKEAADLSMENKRQLLTTAIRTKLGGDNSPGCNGLWVEDMTDTEAVYQQDGQTFSVPYTISDQGAVTIGEPKQVVRQVIYAQMEAIRRSYTDLVALAGTRRIGKLGKELQEVTEMMAALETSTRDKDYPARLASRIAEVAKLVAAVEVAKTEDSQEYPASAFAYVPDAEKPSTWKLRLWEDPTKKVTRKQVGAASAALSPGGFRGNRVDIPADDLPAVKRKIRSAYRSLDVADEDMPKWVKEAEMRTHLAEFIPLTEATITAKGKGQVRIIKPGFNESKSRYYDRAVLARDYKVFEGNKMYADHPTEDEERARPERSIKDWVAVLEHVKVNSDGSLSGDFDVVESWFEAKLSKLRDAGQLDKIGVSINAVGSASRQKIEGIETDFVERLVVSRSVDFVTEPGAGGRIELYEANDPKLDVDLVDVASFKERRPDIVKEIEDAVRNEIIKEAKHKVELEQENKQLKESVDTLTKENGTLKAEKAATEKAKAKDAAQAKIKEAVSKSELPAPSQARLLERFKDAETDTGIAEAITSEKTYIATLAEAGHVKAMGPSAPEAETKKAHDELKESFKQSYLAAGKSEKEADRLAELAVEGR